MDSKNHDIPSEYFNESAVAIFVVTPDHEVIFWSKACEVLTGVAPAAMLGTKNHWQPFYEEERPCLVDIVIDGSYSRLPELYVKFGQSKLSLEGITAEGWYESVGSEKRYMVFDAVPIFNATGEMVAAIETLHDLTDAKERECEKERIISDLNTRISASMSLKGFVRICASCKDIRSKDGAWTALEEFLKGKIDLNFSHGLCPKCAQKLYPDVFR